MYEVFVRHVLLGNCIGEVGRRESALSIVPRDQNQICFFHSQSASGGHFYLVNLDARSSSILLLGL